MRDLNPRPLACEASALPTELIAQKQPKKDLELLLWHGVTLLPQAQRA